MIDEELRDRLYRIERMLELYLKRQIVPSTLTPNISVFGGSTMLTDEEHQELINLVHNTNITDGL